MPDGEEKAKALAGGWAALAPAWRRLWPLAALALLLALLLLSEARSLLTVEGLRANRAMLSLWIAAHPFLAGAVFLAVVAGVMASGFPVVAVVMFAGGLLFGLWPGAALSLLGATAGGLVLFLAARRARGLAMSSRLGPAFRWLEESFRGDEFLALVSLRLVPVFPTAAVTLAAAAAQLKARDFVLASLIGAAPASLVFAGVGAGAGVLLDSGGDLKLAMLRPQILAPLVGLAALAVLAIWFRRRAARKN